MGWPRFAAMGAGAVALLAVSNGYAQPAAPPTDPSGPPSPTPQSPTPTPPPTPTPTSTPTSTSTSTSTSTEPAPPPQPSEPTTTPSRIEPAAGVVESPPSQSPSSSSDGTYPLEYAARPLALPSGAFEATGTGRLAHSRSSDGKLVAARARLAFGQAEILAAATVAIDQTYSNIPGVMPEVDHLTSLLGGARYSIDPDLQIGAELEATTPAGTSHAYIPRAIVATRRHLAPRAALDLTASTAYERSSYGGTSTLPTTTALVFAGEIRVIAQLSSGFAAEAHSSLYFVKQLDAGSAQFVPSSYFTQSAGVRAIVGVSTSFDLFADFDIPGQGFRQFTIGVAGRRLP